MSMNVLAAARCVARDFKGGARALGELMGKSNLADELNPNVKGAKLGLADAVEMEVWADDYRILHAHCAMTRHYPPLPMPPEVINGDQPCMATLAQLAKEFADVVTAVSTDLADREVSDNDLARALREWGELVAKGQQLMQQLAAMNAALHARSA